MRSSRNLENHAAMVSWFFMYYNFARVPSDASRDSGNADISDHVWGIEGIANLF